MKHLTYLMAIFIMGSCAAKHKIVQAQKQQTKALAHYKTIQKNEQATEQLAQSSDSSIHHYGLKIYPKGELTISNGKFIGEADSLIWYGKAQQSTENAYWQKKQATQQIQKEEIRSQEALSTEKVIEKRKVSISWWPLVLLLSILSLLIYGYNKINRNN